MTETDRLRGTGQPDAWMTRSRALALCKRYGHNWEGYSGAEMNGPYSECSRCGEVGKW